MPTQLKSTPELLREAQEAHQQADQTINLGQWLLDRAKEVGRRIEEQVRQVTTDQRGDAHA